MDPANAIPTPVAERMPATTAYLSYPAHQKLKKLGYARSRELNDELHIILNDLARYRGRIEKVRDVIMPKTNWNASPFNL